MRLFLVAAAAIAAAVPAAADAQRSDQHRGTHSRSTRDYAEFERRDIRDIHDERRERRRRGDVYLYGAYGGRDIDRSWQPDSFNDWWHERPYRSHPAWMSRNEDCQRTYWSGGGWRC